MTTTVTKRGGETAVTTDCRSEEGVTVGLIDAIIAIVRVLAKRDLSGDTAVSEALKDLRSDQDLKSILRTPTGEL